MIGKDWIDRKISEEAERFQRSVINAAASKLSKVFEGNHLG